MLSIDDMIRRTSGDDCPRPGDYLRYTLFLKIYFRISKPRIFFSWYEMEWEMNGNIDTETVSVEDVCPARFPRGFSI